MVKFILFYYKVPVFRYDCSGGGGKETPHMVTSPPCVMA